ncbi:MAG: hypothetical protein AAF193_08540, partial [Bacteroidota bacterium]
VLSLKKDVSIDGRMEWLKISNFIFGTGHWWANFILAPESSVKFKSEANEISMFYSNEHQDLVLKPRTKIGGVNEIEINLHYENSYWKDAGTWNISKVQNLFNSLSFCYPETAFGIDFLSNGIEYHVSQRKSNGLIGFIDQLEIPINLAWGKTEEPVLYEFLRQIDIEGFGVKLDLLYLSSHSVKKEAMVYCNGLAMEKFDTLLSPVHDGLEGAEREYLKNHLDKQEEYFSYDEERPRSFDSMVIVMSIRTSDPNYHAAYSNNPQLTPELLTWIKEEVKTHHLDSMLEDASFAFEMLRPYQKNWADE